MKAKVTTTVMIAMPATSTGLMPMRLTSWAATFAQMMAVPAVARYAMPVSIAE